ncbi:MAG: metallophosphoesterase [Candidatus Nanoarchaeia archaeon]|nr:metallophosphoesterase [Candidatus Nanoarchaeia archaeon]
MNKLITNFLEKGILLSPELINSLDLLDKKDFVKNIENYSAKGALILNKESVPVVENGVIIDISWREFERARSSFEKGRNEEEYKAFLGIINYNLSEKTKKVVDKVLEEVKEPEKKYIEKEESSNTVPSVVILKSYGEISKKREVKDFVSHFRARYNSIRGMLQVRQELQNALAINRISTKPLREPVSLIGIVNDIQITKTGHLKIEVEDPSGTMTLLITKNNECFTKAQDIVLDEVIGISGTTGDKVVFVSDLFFPDVPHTLGFKKSEDEAYAVITGDMHVGSKLFLEKEFLNFIAWLNGEYGNGKQRKIAEKVKYVFLLGDLVDGVGIYPGQEEELNIRDIREQYKSVAVFLAKIRKDIKIIITSGNHDALRIGEPQPAQPINYAKELYEMENVSIVSNPAFVNIHSSKNFPGFDFLLYHGYSYDYYADKVERIRLMKPNISERTDLVMKLLLQKRHLAPTHASTVYVPCDGEDPLVIDRLPDFFVSGHIHRSAVLNYNNITMIAGSAWQKQTPFQDKVGHMAEPARVPVVNLKTREVSIINFWEDEPDK